MILLIAAGVIASVLQHAPAFVLERIRPQASRISLAKGWKRLFGAQGFAEFIKSLGKLCFVIAVLTFAVREARHQLLSGMITNPVVFGLVIRDIAIDMLVSITLVMTAIAVADLIWSRFHWRQELRMTRQEVKDEHKQSEGDPIVKSRHAVAGTRPGAQPHDGGGAERHTGYRQPDALRDRAEICTRRGCGADRSGQGPGSGGAEDPRNRARRMASRFSRTSLLPAPCTSKFRWIA